MLWPKIRPITGYSYSHTKRNVQLKLNEPLCVLEVSTFNGFQYTGWTINKTKDTDIYFIYFIFNNIGVSVILLRTKSFNMKWH